MNTMTIKEAIRQAERSHYRRRQGKGWIVCHVDDEAGVIRESQAYDHWRARAVVRENRICDVLLLTGAATGIADVGAIIARNDDGSGDWKRMAWDLAERLLEEAARPGSE